MKIKFFIIGFISAVCLSLFLFILRSEIRQNIQPLINYIENGSLDIENIENKSYRSEIDSLNFTEVITTNDLPLKLEYLDLSPFGFKRIGHIESLNDSLIMMDRTGQFFEVVDNKVAKINISVPNNIEKYYAHHGIGQSDLRAYSFIVDCKRSLLYASFMKYLSNNGVLKVQSTPFNCNHENYSISNIWNEIFTSEILELQYIKGSHNGGGALTQNKEELFLSIGFTDGIANNNDITELVAQDMSSLRGKIIKINKDSFNKVIFSSGHRNLQDLIIYEENRSIYGIEQGPQGGDELNHIIQNKNYGWPLSTFGTKYGAFDHDYKFEKKYNEEVFEDPIFSFVPSIAGCSLIEVKNFHSSWDSDILIGSLKSRSIYRLKIRNDEVLFSEHIWIGKRIRSIDTFNKKIILLTDDNYLISLSIDDNVLANNNKYDDSYAFEPTLSKCLSCHGLSETTPTSAAPSLKNIIGRDIAATNYSFYSSSLNSLDDIWSVENLKMYLLEPNIFAPESSMPRIDLDSNEVDEIIKTLKNYSQ